MRTTRATILGTAVLLLAVSGAQAQYEKRKSTLAIADRVEVPGAVLEPAPISSASPTSSPTATSSSSRAWTAARRTRPRSRRRIAAPRRRPNRVHLLTTAPGEPRVLRSWFAPNDPNGQDFYYPGREGRGAEERDARGSPGRHGGMMPTRPARPGRARDASVAPPPPPPPPPAPAPAETMASNETSSSNATGTDADTLPKTASPYPLIALLGLASLGAAAILRKRRKTA